MAEYISFPFTTEPSDIEEGVYEYVQSFFPDWVPEIGQLEVVVTEGMAQQISELIRLATDVPVAIFKYFGQVVGILPEPATKAVAQITVTAIDTLGHTIPAGTVVLLPLSGDDFAPFEVMEDVVIDVGFDSTEIGEVFIQAVNEGADSSGLTGQPEFQDILDFIDTVVLAVPSAGGQDAELEEDYLDRLATRMQLLADRPILPRDFELYAMSILDVDRALAIDNYIPAVNEKQNVAHSATAGTYTVNFEGQVTAAINWNDPILTIQGKLEALSNIGLGEAIVTGTPSNWTVEFAGTLGASNRTQMAIGTNSLTGGGGAGSLVITTLVAGAAAQTNAERAITIIGHDALGQPLTVQRKNEIASAIEAVRETSFVVHMMDPIYTIINVVSNVKALPNYDVVDLDARVTAAVLQYLNPRLWGQPPLGEDRLWVNTKIVRFWEMVQVINNVEGVDYIISLTINGGGVDVNLQGDAPLPSSASTANITVTP